MNTNLGLSVGCGEEKGAREINAGSGVQDIIKGPIKKVVVY